MARIVTIATDGACSGNPGPGGWGYITDDMQLQSYGSEKHTTNQRMELMAAGRALLALGKSPAHRDLTKIILLSDSRYVIDGMNKKWHASWAKHGWRKADGSEIKHVELWQALVRLTQLWEGKRDVRVEFQWVKGHAGNYMNDLADGLAVRGRDEAKLL